MEERRIQASVDEVWAVLLEPSNYPRWVVGARRFRGADDEWPRPGARFRHTVGIGPIEIGDDTQVLDIEDRRRIVLEARARPAGRARVALHLDPEADGTRVRMYEKAVRGLAAYLPELVQRPFIDLRNREGLRRLALLVERGTGSRAHLEPDDPTEVSP